MPTSPGELEVEVDIDDGTESASPVGAVAPRVELEALAAFEPPRTVRSALHAPLPAPLPAPLMPSEGAGVESAASLPKLVSAAPPRQRLGASEAPTPLTPMVAFDEELSEAPPSEATPALAGSPPDAPPPVDEAPSLLLVSAPTPDVLSESKVAAAPAPKRSVPPAPKLSVPSAPKRSVPPPRRSSPLPPPAPSSRSARPPSLLASDTTSLDDGWDVDESPREELTRPLSIETARAVMMPPLRSLTAEEGRDDLTRPLTSVTAEEGRDDLTRPLTSVTAEEGRDDLTRPLTSVIPSRVESTLSDVDVTNPLPPVAIAAPYGSDMDLTRPIPPSFDAKALLAPPPAPSLRLPVPSPPPLRPISSVALPPPPALPDRPIPLVVAVPPPSSAPMEHPPSIQIAASASRRSVPPPPRRSAPPPPPSAPPRGEAFTTMPRIPRPAPVPKDLDDRRSRRSSIAPTTGSIPPPEGAGSRRWMVALAAITFGIGALAIALRPRTGSLVVTVAGMDGAAVKNVSVRVDGTERCTASPCSLGDLEPGAHLVSASALGLPPSAERAVSVEAGQHAAEHVVLAPAAHTALSGVSVAAMGDGVRVLFDGRDLGAPPVSLHDVEPGTHLVRVTGAEGLYEPYEQSVKLEPGEVRSLGPVHLHLLKGRLQLSEGDGASGAKIAVDGRPIPALPAVLDLSPDESHEITASRPGFSAYEQQVVFDGTAERSVVIALEPASGAPSRAPRVARNVAPHDVARARAAMLPDAPVAASGGATLDLNSIPRTNVVVNGRPVGMTPLIGLRVSPGPQTIVFVHPTLGRKVTSATVGAGARKVAFVKF